MGGVSSKTALVVTSTHLEIQVSLKIKRDIFLSEKENAFFFFLSKI